MFRLTFLILAALLSPAVASAISPATGKPMTASEAYERVRTARAFTLANEADAGVPTLEERSFLKLLKGSQPAKKFESLVAQGTIGGRMYALLGLKYTAPKVFSEKLPKFLRSWRKVPVVISPDGKTKNLWVRNVAGQIRDRDDSRYLKTAARRAE